MSTVGAKDSLGLFRHSVADLSNDTQPRPSAVAKIRRRSAAQQGRRYRRDILCDPFIVEVINRPVCADKERSCLLMAQTPRCGECLAALGCYEDLAVYQFSSAVENADF